MSSELSGELFMMLFLAVGMIVLLMALVGIVLLIYTGVVGRKTKDYTRFEYTLAALVCMFVAGVSWITNLGWFRIYITILAIPFIHTVAFFFVNYFSAARIDNSPWLRRLTPASYITYLAGYLLFPDVADVGGMYMFFGFIRNDAIAALCGWLAVAAFVANVIITVCQLILTIRTAMRVEVKDVEFIVLNEELSEAEELEMAEEDNE